MLRLMLIINFSVVGLFLKYSKIILVESVKSFTKNNEIVNYYKDLTLHFFIVVLLDFDDLFDDDDLQWYKEEQDLVVVYNIVNIR